MVRPRYKLSKNVRTAMNTGSTTLHATVCFYFLYYIFKQIMGPVRYRYLYTGTVNEKGYQQIDKTDRIL
jgi:hypothetical protein